MEYSHSKSSCRPFSAAPPRRGTSDGSEVNAKIGTTKEDAGLSEQTSDVRPDTGINFTIELKVDETATSRLGAGAQYQTELAQYQAELHNACEAGCRQRARAVDSETACDDEDVTTAAVARAIAWGEAFIDPKVEPHTMKASGDDDLRLHRSIACAGVAMAMPLMAVCPDDHPTAIQRPSDGRPEKS